ncbi:hypothetical protein IC614_01455 [Allosphingosinicella flava]|uniref:Lipoprotein n=1 Tax=Allosphingosinicella flava TaxID=2771430 RepID=A0A7T2GK26_9SPHN|nr:hypothetical protein [Sphingosinicella flava]QPQ55310.1 hypothetical protein IC614_01455 [Sphingosinicella flava]
MSSLRHILLLGFAALPLAACGADDVASPGEGVIVPGGNGGTPQPPPPPPPGTPASSCPAGTTDGGEILANRRVCRLPNQISGQTVVRNVQGVAYALSGRVNVGVDVGGDGAAAGGQSASLTIEPGAVLFGASGADFLVVNRGSQIFADGTQTNPIIFTSRQNLLGTATDNSSNQWGGIILLGRAPISNCDGGAEGGTAGCQKLVEGPGANAFYGGNVAADSSGSMRYVQIRYTGFSLIEGNELQGLTTGGVGSGTNLQFIQVHNSGDDGIEIFGGRQNMKNIVITGADDDGLDTDVGYKGFIQFVLAIQRDQAAGATGDTMIEADSTDDGLFDATPRQNTRLANFTFIQRRTGRNAILLRGGTDYALYNGVVVGPTGCLDIDTAQTVQTAGPDEAGIPVFRSVAFSCPTAFDADADNFEAPTFSAGTNNNSALVSTLTNLFVNGANETAVPAFTTLSTISAFFTNTNYIGAVRDAQDTWYRGWTCDSAYAPFGSGAACTAIPVS